MKIIKSEELNKQKITKVIDRKFAEKLYNKDYKIAKCNIVNKPTGFWVSVNEGWEKWCKHNQSNWLVNVVIVELEFNVGYNIMVIDELSDIIDVWKEFINENNIKSKKADGSSLLSLFDENMEDLNFWEWLIDKYKLDGIYLTSKGETITRMKSFLYGWDCESCVIFEPNKVINKVINKIIKK